MTSTPVGTTDDATLVSYQRLDGGIAVVTLDNPPLNLNTLGTISRLLEVCDAIADDQDVRVVVVTGAGDKAFCAGSDIREFADVRHDVVPRKLRRENEAFTAIERLPQPVIAALNGVTLGGGGEIALACDIRIIDERARIGFPEVNLGVFPGSGGVFRLPRVVGLPRAYELMYTGEAIDAAEALRIGLVNRVAAAGHALEDALALARVLAAKPALSLSLVRAAARESLYQDVDTATQRTLEDSHRVFAGPDIAEGVDAFFTKRSPRFSAPRKAAPGATT